MNTNPVEEGAQTEAAPLDGMVRPVVVVVEDDANMRELLATVLSSLDADIVTFDGSQAALEYLENQPVSVVVTDLRMPRVDGINVLRFAKSRNQDTQVILVTGHATVESAVEALKSGAYDYLTKPFENVELICTVERAIDHWRLSRENRRLRAENRIYTEGETIIGRSASMDEVRRLIDA
ncbi:MAG: response regulator, partial [Ectothiorhodospiraceae bacterium]|nr:response regulator [Ectothiorhodospiraceae bacterium]